MVLSRRFATVLELIILFIFPLISILWILLVSLGKGCHVGSVAKYIL